VTERSDIPAQGRAAVALAAALSLALAACAGRTGLAESAVVARPAGAPFGKVLVVGMDRHPELRERIERTLAGELDARGTRAVASTSYLAFAADPPSREEIRDLVQKAGADGILVARLAERGTDYRQVPIADSFHGTPLGFYDYYWNAWPYAYGAAPVEAVPVAALEVRLFDASGDSRLVYRATSEEFRLEDARRALESVSGALAEGLAGAGFVTAGS
jgi:hypothetical protein